MHKLTKGLKKKKKGKKSKHKEEELFKPEELEAYRREHQSTAEVAEETTEATAPADNEEWKKFNALTAGIDTILKKTQGKQIIFRLIFIILAQRILNYGIFAKISLSTYSVTYFKARTIIYPTHLLLCPKILYYMNILFVYSFYNTF